MKNKTYVDVIAKLQERYDKGEVTLDELRQMAQDNVDATRVGTPEFENSVYEEGIRVEVEVKQRHTYPWFYKIPDSVIDKVTMQMYLGLLALTREKGKEDEKFVHIIRMGENGGLLGYLVNAESIVEKMEENFETLNFSGSDATGLDHGLVCRDEEGIFFIETIPKRLEFLYNQVDEALCITLGKSWKEDKQ